MDHWTSHPLFWSSVEISIVIESWCLNYPKKSYKAFNSFKLFKAETCLLRTCLGRPHSLTLDLKSRLMTPLERLSAVRSVVPQTDMVLLFLLDLVISTSSVPPTTAKDRPTDGDSFSVTGGSLCLLSQIQCWLREIWQLLCWWNMCSGNNGSTAVMLSQARQLGDSDANQTLCKTPCPSQFCVAERHRIVNELCVY